MSLGAAWASSAYASQKSGACETEPRWDSFSDHIGQTAGCPTSQRIVYMGVAADCEYTGKYGSTANATQAIITNWNTASALYKVCRPLRPLYLECLVPRTRQPSK